MYARRNYKFNSISRQNSTESSNRDITKEIDKSWILLEKLRAKDRKNVLFGCLNINALLKMIEYLEEIVKNMFDVFLVSKRKLDSSFSDIQFEIDNYNLFRKDQIKSDVGLLF